MYARLNLDFDELSEKLLDLELRGAIALVAGGYQRVK
jgi:predicted Rossmann fold nucleotide-binding protein DprA/Smf involved in DNA uptake